jgi:hypothetical protein
MRVSVGTAHTTNIAKSLKRALAERGFALGLMRCRETVAKMFGYANFHELRVVSLRPDAQPHYENDFVVSDEVVAARRHQYVDRLCVATGLDRATAEDVVDAVNPTGKRKKRPLAGDHAPLARLA